MKQINLASWQFYWTVPLCQKDPPGSVTICNVGSSMGAFSFDYTPFTPYGRNYGVAPQCIAYDLRLLEHFASSLADHAVVIYPLAPFSSCLYEYADDSANWKYYPLLDESAITGFTPEKKREILKYLALNPPGTDPRLTLDENPMKTSEERKTDAEKWMNIWHNNFNIEDFNAPFPENYRVIRQQSVDTFRKIRDLCHTRHWQLITVLPPVTAELRHYLSDGMLREYVYSYVNETEASPFLDYLDHPDFRDPDLYMDSFFLNRKGRMKFTGKVLKDIGFL